MGSSHLLTLRIDKSFKNQNQTKLFMDEYLREHPNLSETYTWTGENWQVIHKKYTKSTVFKFISKTKQMNNILAFKQNGTFVSWDFIAI